MAVYLVYAYTGSKGSDFPQGMEMVRECTGVVGGKLGE